MKYIYIYINIFPYPPLAQATLAQASPAPEPSTFPKVYRARYDLSFVYFLPVIIQARPFSFSDSCAGSGRDRHHPFPGVPAVSGNAAAHIEGGFTDLVLTDRGNS